MARQHYFARWCLSFALLAALTSVTAEAAPRKGKKGGSRAAPAKVAPAAPKAADPLGEIGSGGARGAPSPPAASTGGAPPQRGPTRIDFDDRLIQGQTNKSGAVYLYDRKELQTKSMVKRRETFRQEILSTVYDRQ